MMRKKTIRIVAVAIIAAMVVTTVIGAVVLM
mgnify:CR=1 FL=1